MIRKTSTVQTNRKTLAFLFVLTFFTLAQGSVVHAAEPAKMCWAHYVAWGFDQVHGYDQAALDPLWNAQRFNDRSLLGRHAQTDEGVGDATELQVRTALQYGIDGFCVDLVMREDCRATFYADAMTRFYRAAEGTFFKVAPCVDSTAPSPDAMVQAFADYLKRWGHHPNTCLVGDKPVIFIYNSRPRSLAEWQRIIDALKDKGLAAYWLVQPMGEGTLWENPKTLDDNLAVFDGFYDFGINGFSPAQMRERLANGQQALNRRRPGGLLVAGITQGYLGNGNSFYRPYLNTGTLRNTWDAALASAAQWVCLTTWNDYVEHTHFEPSVVNRDALLRINRDFVARWRHEPVPPRPPQVFVSYHEEASLGDDWTLEVLSLSYTTDPAALRVRLLDDKGQVRFGPDPVALPADRLFAQTQRVPQIGMDGTRLFRVQVQLSTATTTNDWRDLYPVTVRLGHLESLRTIHIPLDSLADEPALTLTSEAGAGVACVRFNRWNLAGKIELLRNGWPVAESDVAHKGTPSVTFRLPVPATPATPADVFVARFSTLSGNVAWSAPVRQPPVPQPATTTSSPVIVTGSDFDEGWWSEKVSRFGKPHMRETSVGADDVYALTYPMTNRAESALRSVSGWQTPLLLGRRHMRMQKDDAWLPQWTRSEEGRDALRFDGTNDCAILPSRSMPYGPFTLEMNVFPQQAEHAMTLFSDTCGLSLKILPTGCLHLTRQKNAITGQKALPASRWTHLAAVYDGTHLRLYIDGVLDAEAPAETQVVRINSLPVIGNDNAFSEGFSGLIGGFHLQCGVLTPDRFVLPRHPKQE
jgi:hypothetical protein